MNSELLTLERELLRLATAFAVDLVKAALRTRVAELGALVEPGALEREAFPVALVPKVSPSFPRREAARKAERPPSETSARAAAPRRAARPLPRPQLVRTPEVAEPDDDTMTNVITDPSLLLDVIAGTARASSVRLERAPRPEAAARVSPPEEVAHAPVLRPGERVLRTAGGNVVLRRGRR